MTDLKVFTSIVGLALGAYETTHGYSAALSSPYTTDIQTVDHPDSAAKVWKLYWYATAFSILLAFIVSYMLNDYWALFAAIIVAAFYWYLYDQALQHKL